MNRKFLGLNMYAWIGVIALGVVVFFVVRHRSSGGSTAATSTGAQSGTGVDESQLASDVAGQVGAALGGTPPATDPGVVAQANNPDILRQLMAQQTQSLLDYFGSQVPLTGAGVDPYYSGAWASGNPTSGAQDNQTAVIAATGSPTVPHINRPQTELPISRAKEQKIYQYSGGRARAI